MNPSINVYTDGSCHTQQLIGTWAAIVLIANKKIIIQGTECNTTHNRMEILGVIKALEYLSTINTHNQTVNVISDSQYVVGLIDRKPKFENTNYKTKAGKPVRNHDLVIHLFSLLKIVPVNFIKIKAHQQQTSTINYNNEVDKLVRANLRSAVNGSIISSIKN